MLTVSPTDKAIQSIKTLVSELPLELIYKINTHLNFQGSKTLSLLEEAQTKRFDLPTLLLKEKNPTKLAFLARESVQRKDWRTVSRIAHTILATSIRKPALSTIVLNLMCQSAKQRQWSLASFIFSTCNRGTFPTTDALYETNLLLQAACNRQQTAILDIYKSTAKILPQHWKDTALILHLQKIDIREFPFAKELDLDREVLSLEAIHLAKAAKRWDLIALLLPRYCNSDDYPLPMADRLSILKTVLDQAPQEIVQQMEALITNPYMRSILF